MAEAPSSEKSRGAVWLNAWDDPVAGLNTHSACMELGDVTGDGNCKLLVADQSKKLRLYKGTNLISEHALMDVPTAMVTFVPDERQPVVPSLAIASGPHIFIYRKLRPYYKFSLPTEEVNEEEQFIWDELSTGKISPDKAHEMLSALRDRDVSICLKSRDFLVHDKTSARVQFVTDNTSVPLEQRSVITCMATIKKAHEEDDSVSQLILGTENRYLIVLDPPGSNALLTVRLPSSPICIAVMGLYDVDYRIICACRNGSMYTVKGGEVVGQPIELDSLPVAVIKSHRSIIVGCMEQVIHSFHVKGKKNFSIYLPSSIQCMEAMPVDKSRHLTLMLVALANGEVRLYNDKTSLCTISSDDVVTGMRFGKFSREDHTLVLAHKSGALAIKILSRSSNLEKSSSTAGPPPEQDVPLNIPKKTKLYVEQTQRERDSGIDIHRVFQRDLCKLRLATARAYVQVLTDGQGPISYAGGTSLRLTATVQGLGPHFKIKLSVQNTGNKPIVDIPLAITYNPAMHHVKRPLSRIPLLVPGPFYTVEIDVESVDRNGGSDSVRVFACNRNSSVPIMSAIINMPFCEPFQG